MVNIKLLRVIITGREGGGGDLGSEGGREGERRG
jgi:hypothetical protein